MRRTNIYLDDDQAAALEAVARREGVSRAEVVRRLVDRGLSERSADVDADLSAIRESFGVLAEDPAPVHAPDARSAHLDQVRRATA